MATQKELEERLDRIDALLAEGVRSHTTDSTSTTYDLASLRQERKEIESRLARLARPVSMQANLGRRAD